MMLLSLLFRSSRPMLTGTLVTACGITLVAIWAITGAGHGAALLARVGILGTLAGAAVMTLTAYRRRHEPPATPPEDQKADASRQRSAAPGRIRRRHARQHEHRGEYTGHAPDAPAGLTPQETRVLLPLAAPARCVRAGERAERCCGGLIQRPALAVRPLLCAGSGPAAPRAVPAAWPPHPRPACGKQPSRPRRLDAVAAGRTTPRSPPQRRRRERRSQAGRRSRSRSRRRKPAPGPPSRAQRSTTVAPAGPRVSASRSDHGPTL
jgi:hypothetical protein